MIFDLGIILVFILYLIAWIIIPGLFVTDGLTRMRAVAFRRLLMGFFVGTVLLACLYFLESFMRIKGLIAILPPACSILIIIYWWRHDRQRLRLDFRGHGRDYLILFLFIYLASFLSFQLKYINALGGQTTQVYHDYLFHTGNIAALSRSYPNMDIRVDGLVFYYHYFFELVFAMCKRIFGFDAFALYMNCNAIMSALPLTLSLGILADRIGEKRDHRLIYLFGLLISCIGIFPLNVVGAVTPLSWLNNHLFTNGNAIGLALSLSILTIDYLAWIWNKEFSLRAMLVLYMLAVAATGFKGTTAALLVGIAWSVFIIELAITRSFKIQKVYYPLGLSIGFLLNYLFVAVGPSPSGSNNRAMVLSPEGTLASSRMGQLITKLGFDYMSFPWVVIGIIGCIILIVGPLILPFGGFCYKKFKTLIKEKEIGDIFDWFAIGSVIMGLIGFVAFSVPGFSQVYFVLTNAGFIFYGAMRFAKDGPKLFRIYTRAALILGACLLVLDMGLYVKSATDQWRVYDTEAGDADHLVDKDTMEAYLWIKDNTESDALLAVDRLSENLDYRSIYFYCSAFSERQIFLEGYDYSDIDSDRIEALKSMNERFYSKNFDVAMSAMDLAGVDYLVVTKHSHPHYQENSDRLTLVFENDAVKIYKNVEEAKGLGNFKTSK
ncbi:MAG: hypothetical protein K5773_02410 [Pseudobutyrivibrio sp.]|nr:hypothetical protein [Pseudobutyrivibrio sp.]